MFQGSTDLMAANGRDIHLGCVWVFPVVPKQVAHGHLVASVEPVPTLAVQIQGVRVQSTVIHNAKGFIHL